MLEIFFKRIQIPYARKCFQYEKNSFIYNLKILDNEGWKLEMVRDNWKKKKKKKQVKKEKENSRLEKCRWK